MKEEYIKTQFPLAYKYLLDNKEKLESRDLEKNAKWYQFARSQSINSINKDKIVIKHIISNDTKKVKYFKLDKNTAVYSGVYITSDKLDEIEKIIDTERFCDYCKQNGKDMSGNCRYTSYRPHPYDRRQRRDRYNQRECCRLRRNHNESRSYSFFCQSCRR